MSGDGIQSVLWVGDVSLLFYPRLCLPSQNAVCTVYLRLVGTLDPLIGFLS